MVEKSPFLGFMHLRNQKKEEEKIILNKSFGIYKTV